nr:DUF6527 family protein [uncultured Arsenicibacter sp.]
MKTVILQHSFVKFVPEILEEGVLYISVDYCTAIHNCVCGCGNRVVTPISPRGWELTFNGDVVSLSPSIGNWSFACRSHYWIRNSVIHWSDQWSDEEIKKGRLRDQEATRNYLERIDQPEVLPDIPEPVEMDGTQGIRFWKRMILKLLWWKT